MIQDSDVIDAPNLPAIREEPAMDPMALLRVAVERGTDPGQLKALVDLQEQWRSARAKEAFSAAMNQCQAEMPCIVRDGRNSHTNSTYVKLETVTAQAKPIWTRHGFSLSFSEADCPRKDWTRTVCLVRHSEGCSETHHIDLPVDGTGARGGKSSMNEVQAAVSTGSYGQRVLTCRVFDITIADTDLDGNRPPHDNPPQGNQHSKPAPRGQRNQPPAEEPENCPTVQELTELVKLWQGRNPEPSGDKVKWSVDYKMWVMGALNRTFDPSKRQQWTREEYATCLKLVEAMR